MISFYLNPTDSFAPRFYCQPKMHKPSTSINFVVWYTSSPLGTITKYIANILKAYVKDENMSSRIFLSPITSEMSPLKTTN